MTFWATSFKIGPPGEATTVNASDLEAALRQVRNAAHICGPRHRQPSLPRAGRSDPADGGPAQRCRGHGRFCHRLRTQVPRRRRRHLRRPWSATAAGRGDLQRQAAVSFARHVYFPDRDREASAERGLRALRARQQCNARRISSIAGTGAVPAGMSATPRNGSRCLQSSTMRATSFARSGSIPSSSASTCRLAARPADACRRGHRRANSGTPAAAFGALRHRYPHQGRRRDHSSLIKGRRRPT